jgi:hypothetical protein
MGLDDQLEFLLVTSLRSQASEEIKIKEASQTNLVWMVLERRAPVRLFDICLVAVARNAKDLVVVLRLAASERRLGAFELATQRVHVTVCVFKLGLLERGAEVRDRVLVLLVVQSDARACAQRLEGARL